MSLKIPEITYTEQSSHLQEPQGDVWRLVAVLVRKRKLIFRCAVGAGLVAVVIALFMKPQYEATMVLIPPSSPSTGLGALAALAGGAAPLISEGALGGKSTGESYVSLLSSQTVEDAVIQRFHLMDDYKVKKMSDARKVLERKVTVFYGARDGMIRLSVLSRSPQQAVDLANGYYQEFQHLSAGMAVTEASRKRQFYQHEMEAAKDRLATAEQELKKTEDETGLLHLETQARVLIASASTLRAQIAAKEVEIRAMQTYAAADNAQLAIVKNELAGLQAQLARLTSADDKSDGVVLTKPVLSRASLEYIRRLRNVKYYETLFEMLAKQFEAAQLEEPRQGSTMQVVDRPQPPDTKVPQHRVLIVLGAFFAGLLFSSIWVIVADRWHAAGISQKLRDLRSTP